MCQSRVREGCFVAVSTVPKTSCYTGNSERPPSFTAGIKIVDKVSFTQSSQGAIKRDRYLFLGVPRGDFSGLPDLAFGVFSPCDRLVPVS
jgi:hypothetical protein